MRLPFDAHNHVHMGPSPPVLAVLGGNTPTDLHGPFTPSLSGLAIMSTHPRDYPVVTDLTTSMPNQCPGLKVVPCYGVHPWFLHDIDEDDWKIVDDTSQPLWITQLERLIKDTPEATVGEIGLDGFHFDPDTQDLTSSMEKQVEAFEAQMMIAARHQRPVSIHAVQCFGPLLTSLAKLKKSSSGLPPKVYFHAFGGKLGLIDQLTALCGRQPGKVYFGFAPVINFRSNKTFDVIRRVGLERLVLETDHEDAACVPESMNQGVSLIAQALDEPEETVVATTTKNAMDFYKLS